MAPGRRQARTTKNARLSFFGVQPVRDRFDRRARVAPARAHLADGLELADSRATDAHKWLNSPDCGIVLARDGEAIRRSMPIGADYLPSDTKNPTDYTLEMSRRSRGVDVWAVLRSLGRSGLAEMVERHCQLATRFADAFRAAMRVSVINWSTTEADVDRSVDAILRIARAEGATSND
jgi:glutamate/tyrosine decarboxylase-like PLP-dependent enzyme